MLALLLTACWSQEERVEMSEARVEPAMEEHAQATEAARQALLRGDLAALRAAGDSIAKQWPVRGMPPALAERQEAVRDAARALASAPDIDEGAQALTRLGAACGDCHAARDRVVELPAPPDFGPGQDLPSQMKRHAWAGERVWLGLTGPSEQALREAYTALADAPMVPTGSAIDAPIPAEAVALELRVHDLAAFLRDAPPSDRARLAGELFSTCAACHGLLKGGPAAP